MMQTTKKVLAVSVMPDKRGRGRPALGEKPMTPAEKNRRYRERAAAEAKEQHARFETAMTQLDSVLARLSDVDRFDAEQAKTKMRAVIAWLMQALPSASRSPGQEQA